MPNIVEQLCIKSFEVTAENGDYWKAEQGKKYATTAPLNDETMVTVISNFWVLAPKENFVLVERRGGVPT